MDNSDDPLGGRPARIDQVSDRFAALDAADEASSRSADSFPTEGWPGPGPALAGQAKANVKVAPNAHDPLRGCPDRIGGRYRVEACLGEGAFGRVYRCRDEVLKRTVAVKVPHRERLNNPALYLTEAQVLAGLEHPAIVRVYDYGQTADGLCYVVSMFIEGSDLKKRVQAAPLSHREAAEVVAAVAEALHYAHIHGVVHRDIKPANILIDSQLRPYVADFGLALKDEEFGEHGHGAGTPAYMSPGAGPRRGASRRWPLRCFQPGRGALRAVDGKAPVSRHHRRGPGTDQGA